MAREGSDSRAVRCRCRCVPGRLHARITHSRTHQDPRADMARQGLQAAAGAARAGQHVCIRLHQADAGARGPRPGALTVVCMLRGLICRFVAEDHGSQITDHNVAANHSGRVTGSRARRRQTSRTSASEAVGKSRWCAHYYGGVGVLREGQHQRIGYWVRYGVCLMEA